MCDRWLALETWLLNEWIHEKEFCRSRCNGGTGVGQLTGTDWEGFKEDMFVLGFEGWVEVGREDGPVRGNSGVSQHGLCVDIIRCFGGVLFLLLCQIMRSLKMGGAFMFLPTTTVFWALTVYPVLSQVFYFQQQARVSALLSLLGMRKWRCKWNRYCP